MSDKPKLSPEAERLLEARRAAVEELRQIDGQDRSIHDAFVIRLANARMFEESITFRVLSGETVTASEAKAASDLVESARAAVPAPIPEVKLTIVRKTLPELARELGKPVDEPVPVQPATTLAEPTDEEKCALARVEPVSARVSRNAYQRARESRQTTSERPFDP